LQKEGEILTVMIKQGVESVTFSSKNIKNNIKIIANKNNDEK